MQCWDFRKHIPEMCLFWPNDYLAHMLYVADLSYWEVDFSNKKMYMANKKSRNKFLKIPCAL